MGARKIFSIVKAGKILYIKGSFYALGIVGACKIENALRKIAFSNFLAFFYFMERKRNPEKPDRGDV